MADDDLLLDDIEGPRPKKLVPKKEKPKREGPTLVGSGLTALRDWANWNRLILIAVVLLVAHLLWYNRDPIIIDVWGWQPPMPKILAFILFGLLGALAMYLWQNRDKPGWGIRGGGQGEE